MTIQGIVGLTGITLGGIFIALLLLAHFLAGPPITERASEVPVLGTYEGELVFDDAEVGQNRVWIVTNADEQKILELVFDERSLCNAGTASQPCMQISAQYSVAFGDRSARVEGVQEGNSILVEDLYLFDASE